MKEFQFYMRRNDQFSICFIYENEVVSQHCIRPTLSCMHVCDDCDLQYNYWDRHCRVSLAFDTGAYPTCVAMEALSSSEIRSQCLSARKRGWQSADIVAIVFFLGIFHNLITAWPPGRLSWSRCKAEINHGGTRSTPSPFTGPIISSSITANRK